jgi:hypothetical protein
MRHGVLQAGAFLEECKITLNCPPHGAVVTSKCCRSKYISSLWVTDLYRPFSSLEGFLRLLAMTFDFVLFLRQLYLPRFWLSAT